MNDSAVSSRNSLFKYLSGVYRMPNRKAFFSTIKNLKVKGMIRISGTQIYLTLEAKLYLYRLDADLEKMAFY
jgi:hypothetical protein